MVLSKTRQAYPCNITRTAGHGSIVLGKLRDVGGFEGAEHALREFNAIKAAEQIPPKLITFLDEPSNFWVFGLVHWCETAFKRAGLGLTIMAAFCSLLTTASLAVLFEACLKRRRWARR
jgi:hypothetical protein